MDLLDRLLGHDAWTTRQLLIRCRELTDAQLDQDFDIGHRTVRETLHHIIWNMEAWTDVMAGRDLRGNPGLEPAGRTLRALFERLDRAETDLAAVAKPIAQRQAWDDTYVDRVDNPPKTRTYGGTLAHVITHGMHHRAQVLYLLRRLGLKDLLEGDALSWEDTLGERGAPGPSFLPLQ